MPQVAAGIQNPQEFHHIKIPQQKYLSFAASVSNNGQTLPISHSSKRLYFISTLFYILQSNALNHSDFSCQQTHLLTCWFIFLTTVSPRTVKKPVRTQLAQA